MNGTSNSLVVVISQGPLNKPENRQLELLLAEQAARSGFETFITPHLHNVKADGPVMSRLGEIDGSLAIVSWMYPRATRWLMHRRGLAANERALHVFDARETNDPEAFVVRLKEIARSLEWSPVIDKDALPEPVVLEEKVKLRWYPVVDYRQCIGCMECIDFCLFGVYGLDEDNRLFVEQPDSCRAGCPACARVCPTGAIMFPEHQSPEIAGAVTEANADQESSNTRAQEERQSYLEQAGMTEKRPTEKPGVDELDSLMDELEKDLD